MKRFLVIRTDKIGDVILTLPVITNIRLAYPDAFIGFLAREYTKKILEENPHLSDVIFYDPEAKHKGIKGVLRLAKMLKSYNFDASITVFPTFNVALALFLAKIPVRIGVGYRWYSFLFNKKEYFHRSRVEKHELEYNLDLLKPLGVEVKDKNIKIYLGKKDIEFADDFLKKNNINTTKPMIGIHPRIAKKGLNWDIGNFAELINSLSNDFSIILFEGKGEEKITEEVLSKTKNKPNVLKGDADIKQMAAVISKLKVFVSGDTGTMHVAASVGTPTVSLFCPIFVLSPKRWGPWGNKSIAILPEVPGCNKCKYESCKHYNCMNLITVDLIISKIKEML